MSTKPKEPKKVNLVPISETELPGWKTLIDKSKKLVEQGNKVQFQLILLAGEVETKYGENRIARWAEAIGIAQETAKGYKSLYNRGVQEEFVKQWTKLGYARVKAIINYNGRASNPSAQYWLQYALENPTMSADALRGRMLDLDTNNAITREALYSDYKLALAQKADAENLKPELKSMLEEFGEMHPHMQDQVLSTIFLSKEGQQELQLLEEAAGIKSIEYEKRQQQLKNFHRKIKQQQRWWAENIDRYIEIIEQNEMDMSYEVASAFDQLCHLLQKAVGIKPLGWKVDPQLVDVVNIEDARGKKNAAQ